MVPKPDNTVAPAQDPTSLPQGQSQGKGQGSGWAVSDEQHDKSMDDIDDAEQAEIEAAIADALLASQSPQARASQSRRRPSPSPSPHSQGGEDTNAGYSSFAQKIEQCLQDASASGTGKDAAELAAALGHVPQDQIQKALQDLMMAGVIYHDGGRYFSL